MFATDQSGITLYGDKELKWKSKTNLRNGLKNTFDWYLNNIGYYTSIKKRDITKRLGSTND